MNVGPRLGVPDRAGGSWRCHVFVSGWSSRRNPLISSGCCIEGFSLADYRIRHAQYKTDPHLRAAHAAFPWVVTWDDHEVENNYADDISEDPAQDQAAFRQRRAAAYQAYYEHPPLRRSSLPSGPDMQLYRRLRFGNLLEMNVLDGRQYRDDQACGDGLQVPCDDASDPSRTMLGEEVDSEGTAQRL